MVSQLAEHAAMYSAFVVLRAMLDCFLLCHKIMADHLCCAGTNSFNLETMEGEILKLPVNALHIKRYYPPDT
jgi:hypothetical protein